MQFAPKPYPEPPKKPWAARPYNSKVWPDLSREKYDEFKKRFAAWKDEVIAIGEYNTKLVKEVVEHLKENGFPVQFTEYKVTGRSGRSKALHHSVREELFRFLPKAPDLYRTSLAAEENYFDEQMRIEQVEKRNSQQMKRRDAAVQWLLDRGKKYGEDFTAETAIYEADAIAADEEIKRQKAAGGWHVFDGEDNCTNCNGWDGESRRCDCGNRRVYWDTDEMHFDGGYLRAVAY